MRNTFYQTTCENIDQAISIIQHPDASVGEKALAVAYVGTEAVAHGTVVVGAGTAAVGCLTGAGTAMCAGAGSAVTAASADGDPTNEVAAVANGVSNAANAIMTDGDLTNELSATSRLIPQLGQKLNFLFGKATGSEHNVARSQDMFYKLRSIGLNDMSGWRDYVSQHLDNVLNDPDNIVRVQENGRAVRESLLWGPLGAVKLETVWEAEKLITFYVYSSR